MVTSRFGSDSPQYRGVLSMYVFGSIFGAIIVSLVASVLSSLDIFRWEALAMGAGVGSGSMMAAGIASVTAAHPENADTIAALATTANLIASLAGVYLALWISLPLADRFYRFLTRRQKSKTASGVTAQIGQVAAQVLDVPKVNLHPGASLLILGGAGLVTATIASVTFSFDMVITYLIMAALVALGLWVTASTRGKVPALIIVITLGTIITSPWVPVSGWVVETSASVDFLSVITLMLAIAGLSIGKDLPMLKQIGWKILPVGFVVIGATFLASTVIAEFVLRIFGR